MGNFREVTVEGEGVSLDKKNPYFQGAIMTKTSFNHLKKVMSNTDGDHQVDAKSLGKDKVVVYSVYSEGSHGDFDSVLDDDSIKPLQGKLRILYHDRDAPQILRRTIKAKKLKEVV